MYTIKKNGSMFQVESSAGLVQFSSLKKAYCAQWIVDAESSQEEKENKFLNN